MSEQSKSYISYWILLLITAIYSMAVAFLPWMGYDLDTKTVEFSSIAVIGFVILGVIFLLVYIRDHLRTPTPLRVDQEQVLPEKLKYSKNRVETGRKIEEQKQVPKRDRWEDGTCEETYVKDLCTTCVHHVRRYYGNYCKHFGMVVDKPKTVD